MNLGTMMRLGFFLAALAFATACGTNAGIVVSNAWVRALPTTSVTAAYMTITNVSAGDDRLLAATTDLAASVELHESREADGMIQMSSAPAIRVPAYNQTNLQPGGTHIMLIGLKRELKSGDEVTLILHFEKAGAVTVNARVRVP